MSNSNRESSAEKDGEDPLLMLVNGEWVCSGSGATREISNPSTGETAGRVFWGDRSDAVRALEAAEQAFQTWCRTTVHERGNLLREAAGVLLSRLEKIASVICSENGKPIDQARAEVKNAASRLSLGPMIREDT